MTTDAGPPAEAGTRWIWLAFVWGLAEAVFFFIVPDVLSSRLVLCDARRGFLACLVSLAGALIGGAFLFFLGGDSGPVLHAMDYLPGISSAMIEQARLGLEQDGLQALFSGAFSGIPYKLYAVQAAATGVGLGAFLLFSAAARLMRFGLVTAIAWAAGAALRSVPVPAKLRIHAIAWVLFYCLYFWRLGL